jgi:hypothetical protein
MGFTIAGHPELDMSYFTGARQLINAASSKYVLPVFYHHAYDLLRAPMHGTTRLVPFKGFQFTPPGESEDKSIHMEGITKIIDMLFHPVQLDVSTGGAMTGGSSRGCKVDDQIALLVNEGRAPDNKMLHRYTILTLKRLYQEELMPFAAQFAVSMPSAGIATAADILCINKDGLVCNVQLKTGFERDYNTPSKIGMRMHSPHVPCLKLTEMIDSHKNRHRLQLIVEHAIMSRMVHDSIVLVVSSSCTDIMHVDRDPELMAAIIENIRKRSEKTELTVRIAAMRRTAAIKQIYNRSRGRGGFGGGSRSNQALHKIKVKIEKK